MLTTDINFSEDADESMKMIFDPFKSSFGMHAFSYWLTSAVFFRDLKNLLKSVFHSLRPWLVTYSLLKLVLIVCAGIWLINIIFS